MNQSLDACVRTLERLEQYLDVLARFGYGDRASIVAFHPGYAAVTTWSLDKRLTVAGPLNDRAAAPDVASRAVRVHRRANAESLEYLVDRMPARTMDALNQRLFVMDMCPTLVRYVVEEQRLNDIRSLYDWDYAEAWGDKDYAGFRTIDDAERVLIEDAFRRKNLAVLEGNRKCLDDVVSAHVRAAVLAPIDRTDEGWEAYCEACRQTECRERDALYPILHVVLNETAGMPLRSLLEAATQAGPTFLRQCDRQGLRYGLTPFFVYSEMPAYLAQSRFSRLWSQLYSEVQLH
ncbi:hypothetical protein [Burkholderia sp. BCC1998]|uniref:hypothetical protein n=1 Tax=Burkholderia sp. BCC1998 TaxID=2817447 RepID=UPI002AB76480|nr:hypothetical protein [Burkholderia sp. BCC1998]